MKAWQMMYRRRVWAYVSAAAFALTACAPLVRAGGGNAGTTVPPKRPATSTTIPGPAPGPVVVERVGPGGGSGEIVVRWAAVPSATGYRVLRSESRCGPFDVVADFNVTTGKVSAAPDVVNIWSAEHSYIPLWEPFAGPDRSPWFEYVEISRTGEHCFKVLAYNQAGNGPASTVACGSPP